MRDWLKAGGAYPDSQELYDDLIGPETKPRVDGKIQLESKEEMKSRGLPSPNKADALALSFAFPVASKAERDREALLSQVGGSRAVVERKDEDRYERRSDPVDRYDR